MRDDLERRLIQRYRHLYEPCSVQRGGTHASPFFACGDGWFPIIDLLSDILVGFEPAIQIEMFDTSKEELVLVISGGQNCGEMGAIVAAQFYSSRVCSRTGAPTDYSLGFVSRPGDRTGGRGAISTANAKWIDEIGTAPLSDTVSAPTFADEIGIDAFKPKAAIDQLRHRHAFFNELSGDIPRGLFDLADCSISAMKYFLNPGRFDLSRLCCSELSELTWNIETGLTIDIRRNSALEAARKYVSYIAGSNAINEFETSEILVEDQIHSNITQVKRFAREMSLRVSTEDGFVTFDS